MHVVEESLHTSMVRDSGADQFAHAPSPTDPFDSVILRARQKGSEVRIALRRPVTVESGSIRLPDTFSGVHSAHSGEGEHEKTSMTLEDMLEFGALEISLAPGAERGTMRIVGFTVIDTTNGPR